jgi:hypothetical protein
LLVTITQNVNLLLTEKENAKKMNTLKTVEKNQKLKGKSKRKMKNNMSHYRMPRNRRRENRKRLDTVEIS